MAQKIVGDFNFDIGNISTNLNKADQLYNEGHYPEALEEYKGVLLAIERTRDRYVPLKSQVGTIELEGGERSDFLDFIGMNLDRLKGIAEAGIKDVKRFVPQRGDGKQHQKSNFAMADQAMAKGGIDLNQANMAMQIKRDGKGVPLPVSQQSLEDIHIDGLTPTVLSIKSLTHLPMLSEE